MSTHPRAPSVAQASEDIAAKLTALQREHGLTDTEMLLAVLTWQQEKLEGALRAERHPAETGEKP